MSGLCVPLAAPRAPPWEPAAVFTRLPLLFRREWAQLAVRLDELSGCGCAAAAASPKVVSCSCVVWGMVASRAAQLLVSGS